MTEVYLPCDAAGLRPILKFAYSGVLEITEENVLPLFLASNVTDLKEVGSSPHHFLIIVFLVAHEKTFTIIYNKILFLNPLRSYRYCWHNRFFLQGKYYKISSKGYKMRSTCISRFTDTGR